ncbi:MAG: PAS domain S-box protein, partial [Proteobacteria bacterium]|nr:PAS domain S-box protein [Pseudomonadota bacterium]
SIVDTGEKAIKKAEEDKPDIILMDIRIKGEMDGIDAAEEIRNRLSIPVIFSTAYLDEERIERAKITMPFGYILKPVQERDLKVTIEMALYVSKVDTKRKMSEEALFESNIKLEHVFNSANDGIVIADINNRIYMANNTICKMLGYSHKELLACKIKDLFCKKDLVNIENELGLLAKGDIPVAQDILMQRKNGGILPTEVKASIITLGSVQYVMGTFRDITERKQAEEALKESESRIRIKLDAILNPEGNIGLLNLKDIIDVQEFQSMMDDYYKLTNIGVGILDVDGTVLVHTGWQDICVKFHRIHPESLKNCIEADTVLSNGVAQGEFKLYKCKNNMWDMSTPIMVGGKHLGNIFFGQFFFNDEVPEREVFISQAQQYGYDQKDYLQALDKVPHFSRETVQTAMSFYSKFSSKIAKLGYSNIRLARKMNENGKAKENEI